MQDTRQRRRLARRLTSRLAHRLGAPLLVATLLSGCARPSDDPAHPVSGTGWVETRLYFGLGDADRPGAGIGAAAWRDFLDREVTPRFPDGLSVLDVYGQWQGPGETTPKRLRSKLLVIDYPDDVDNRARVEAIRQAWKHRTGDRSVLRVTAPADISF